MEFDLIQTFRVMRFQRYFKSLQLSGQEFKLNVRQRRRLMYEPVEDGRGFAEIRYGSICGHRDRCLPDQHAYSYPIT